MLKIQTTYVRFFWGNRKLTFFKEGLFNYMKRKKKKTKEKSEGNLLCVPREFCIS